MKLMKTKLILASLIALTFSSNAQYISTSGSAPSSNQVFKAGDGAGTIHYNGGSGGVLIQSSSGDRALLELQSPSSSGTGANRTVFQALSTLTYLDISGGTIPLYLQGSGGRVGIGVSSPDGILHSTRSYAPTGSFSYEKGMKSDISSSGSIPGGGATYGIIGVQGNSSSGVSNQGWTYGVWGYGNTGQQNIGGYFEAVGPSGGDYNNMGVYATASGNSNSSKNWAGYFQGNVYISGTYGPSDRKLKSDIKPFVNAMDKIMSLKPSTYMYRSKEFKDMNLPEGKQVGLIAQELEEVFPEFIMNMSEVKKTNDRGETTVISPEFKSVSYTSLITVLIAGLQEQQKQIEEQKQQIADLMKSSNTTGLNNNGDLNTFKLGQNEPNPFNGETVIKYTLPQNTNNASMVVYDLSGKQIASFPITEKGSSSMTLTSEKLAAGIYIYSIVADNKILDSKRMVVAEK
jgi:hypothetical protein